MRERVSLLILFSFVFSCAQPGAAPGRHPASDSWSVPKTVRVPNEDAFQGWRDKAGYRSSDIDPSSVTKVKPGCGGSRLFPSHPQQTLKLYHVYKTGSYDHWKLKADDSVCTIRGESSGSKPPRCLKGDYLEYVVISDVFEDSCGNRYRGFWEVSFQLSEENMGTLFSLGRTLYRNPKSEFSKDMIVGATYPVPLQSFLFLSPLFRGDAEAIERSRNEAIGSTHRYDSRLKIFSPR